jgi:hypothetical protein
MRTSAFFTRFLHDRRKKHLKRTLDARLMLIRVLHSQGIYMPELSRKIAEAAALMLQF